MRHLTLGILLALLLVGRVRHEARWPVPQAARISYDKQTDTFTLTNLSPHTVWYDGRVCGGASPVYERRLPRGEWACTAADRCGTGRAPRPLGSGRSISLGGFRRELGTGMMKGDATAYEFVERKGPIDKLPARLRLYVQCHPRDAGEYVVSDAVRLP